MSTTTLPRQDSANSDADTPTRTEVPATHTDEGLRAALQFIERSGSWETPTAHRLLTEVRRRAVRNAAHIATATDTATGRGLVDDVLLAAWMVLRRHSDKVLAAQRPWAYLMSSAQRQVLDEVRAQQLLTNTASIRGRAREILPSGVRPVGTAAVHLATAFRHETSGYDDYISRRRLAVLPPQLRRHHELPLVTDSEDGTALPAQARDAWFVEFIDLLVAHGADRDVTVAAVDRLADVFTTTRAGWWEWSARRDPALARLGLNPDQCGALVALVAGSRKCRHNGKRDSLLGAVRVATEQGHRVELSPDQRRRIATYTRTARPSGQASAAVREPAAAGV